jgi:hypothetical protein
MFDALIAQFLIDQQYCYHLDILFKRGDVGEVEDCLDEINRSRGHCDNMVKLGVRRWKDRISKEARKIKDKNSYFILETKNHMRVDMTKHFFCKHAQE